MAKNNSLSNNDLGDFITKVFVRCLFRCEWMHWKPTQLSCTIQMHQPERKLHLCMSFRLHWKWFGLCR